MDFIKLINQSKEWMRNYSPEILLKWILTCSIYPSNQKYQLRFEFLLATILSLKDDEFENEVLEYGELEEFITKFKISTDHFAIEDFYIFDQLNLIPYFYRGRKYFFFYGITERPYETLRILDWIILLPPQSCSQEIKLIQKIFLQILNYQTSLLNDLSEYFAEKPYETDKFQVPPIEFFDKFSDHFLISGSGANNEFTLELGNLSFNSTKDLRNLIEGVYYKHLYIKTLDDQYFFILPQLHIEILKKIIFDLILNSPDKDILKSNIFKNLKSRFRLTCGKFFSPKNFILGVANDERVNLSSGTDLIVFFEDFLLIFKIINPFSKAYSEELNKAHRILEKFTGNIQKEVFLNLIIDKNHYYRIPKKELSLITFTIFEIIEPGLHQIRYNFNTDFSNQIFNLMDIISMFEVLPSKLSFIKFLQEREVYREKLFTIDGINILALYLMNNQSIPDFGESKLSLDPHFWIDYYSKHLFNKFKDDIYELVEKDFPYKFNIIKNWNKAQGLYECIDTHTLKGANILKSESNLIWVFNPPHHEKLDYEDFKFAMQVIGPMYTDYLQRIIVPFKGLLSNYSSYFLHGIFLVPLKICENNPRFERFKDLWSKINLDKPLIVTSFINTELKLISLVFYNFDLWCEKFYNSETNDNCRYAIIQLINSIISFFEPKLSIQEKVNKAEQFLSSHFEENEKDYLVVTTPAWNPQIQSYPSHQKFHQGDQEMVIKQVEDYFREMKIDKRKYPPDESKRIYNNLYLFLYNKLREKTSCYDLSLLLKAYAELELIEAKRYNLLMETGIKSDALLDSDYIEYFRKKLGDLMNLSSSTRFLMENLIKFGISGKEKINAIDYGYLQALSNYLVIISQRSDFTHSEIIGNLIEIKSNYKFDEIQEPLTFDFDSYNDTEFNGKIELSRSLLKTGLNQVESTENVNPAFSTKEEEIVMILENAFFEEFEFTFTEMMRILFILSTCEFNTKKQEVFPLIRIETENLISEIQVEYESQFKNKTDITGNISTSITKQVIRNVVNYISLDFNSYKDEDVLIHLKLLKKKERLTICPIIKLENMKEFLFGYESCHVSFNLWHQFIFSGVFPYSIPAKSSLSRVLKLIHAYRDKTFENICGDIIKDVLGENNYVLRLKKYNRISDELPKYPECGEIDLLAVNRKNKILFILDAKNYYLRLHPFDIKNQIKRILTSEDSDFNKLKKKEDFVTENIDFFLDYFNIKDKSKWTTKKGFVIRHNFPTAHVPNYEVDFIFEEELGEYLNKC
jgi:hypothetical protein